MILKRATRLLLLLLAVSLDLVCLTKACTTILVTKGASSKNVSSCFVSHTNDGEGNTDGRLVKVPPRVFDLPAKRPIFASHLNFPRYVGSERGADNYPRIPNYQEVESQPIGYIDEVEKTYGIFEAAYGVGNDQGLVMAESTCEGIFGARPRPKGKALFSIEELTKIALERTATAVEAVKLMGALAEKEGFYGAGFEGLAESLLVADPEEGWIFHVLPDNTGASAVWAAQRVPDGHVAVVANSFVIREMDLSDPENFLGSNNIETIALELNLWKRGTPFDFSRIYSKGEYNHKYYSGRRQWRALHLLAPHAAADLNLGPFYGSLRYDAPYPATLKLSSKDAHITLKKVFSIMRDAYEGTQFSPSESLAGGPFGTPDRYDGGEGEAAVSGTWERTINIFRSTYSFVAVAKQKLVFWGPHAAKTTCYVPLSILFQQIPSTYSSVWQGIFSRKDAFWAFRYVATISQSKFSYMIKDIQSLQDKFENLGLQKSLKATEFSFDVANKLAEDVLVSWWNLADHLVFRYSDGYINEVVEHVDRSSLSGKKLEFKSAPTGYPAEWLSRVGYNEGPPPLGKSSWNAERCSKTTLNTGRLQLRGEDA